MILKTNTSCFYIAAKGNKLDVRGLRKSCADLKHICLR